MRTERLHLRQWRDDDLSGFAALNADPRVMQFMPKHLSGDESRAWLERAQGHINKKGWGLWAVEVPGVAPFIGFAGLAIPSFKARFTPCVEVGWRLAHVCWGQGYATEAARAALDYGFGVLGLPEIVSFTSQENLRSQAVMQRLGMHRNITEDFMHPGLGQGHALAHHVLYRIVNPKQAGKKI